MPRPVRRVLVRLPASATGLSLFQTFSVSTWLASTTLNSPPVGTGGGSECSPGSSTGGGIVVSASGSPEPETYSGPWIRFTRCDESANDWSALPSTKLLSGALTWTQCGWLQFADVKWSVIVPSVLAVHFVGSSGVGHPTATSV